jgi:hypothetical protein
LEKQLLYRYIIVRLSEKTKVMIRTGKTADGIGHGKKRNTVTGHSAGTSSVGDTPSWSFHNGRFGETSKTGSSHRFVSSEVHAQSTGMLMSTAASADKDDLARADEEDIFKGIMDAAPAVDELVAEKENDVDEHEEEDLLFIKAMDAYEANAASIDECISVAEKMLNDIPVMVPKDKADSGIFDPAHEKLVFDKVAAIPAGVSYGQTRSGRNVRNPLDLDRRPDVLPTGSAN